MDQTILNRLIITTLALTCLADLTALFAGLTRQKLEEKNSQKDINYETRLEREIQELRQEIAELSKSLNQYQSK